MASPEQKRELCVHVMSMFNVHSKCTRCRDNDVGSNPCELKKEFKFCSCLTSEHKYQLATHSCRHQMKTICPLRNLYSQFTVTQSITCSSDNPDSAPKQEININSPVCLRKRVHRNLSSGCLKSKLKGKLLEV